MTSPGDSRDEENYYVLVATMDNAKNLSSILKSINFKEVNYGFMSKFNGYTGYKHSSYFVLE